MDNRGFERDNLKDNQKGTTESPYGDKEGETDRVQAGPKGQTDSFLGKIENVSDYHQSKSALKNNSASENLGLENETSLENRGFESDVHGNYSILANDTPLNNRESEESPSDLGLIKVVSEENRGLDGDSPLRKDGYKNAIHSKSRDPKSGKRSGNRGFEGNDIPLNKSGSKPELLSNYRDVNIGISGPPSNKHEIGREIPIKKNILDFELPSGNQNGESETFRAVPINIEIPDVSEERLVETDDTEISQEPVKWIVRNGENNRCGHTGEYKRKFAEISDEIVLDPNKLITAQAEEEIGSLLEKPAVNGQPRVLIERSLFSQKHFDENFEAGSRPSPTLGQIVRKKLLKCRCSGVCLKRFLYTLFPFINIMKNYNIREDITGDIVSGLTVGIMHIPQGMAYGMLTTLPPVYGLYMSFFPVLLYFFFGSSKHVSMGTFAVACLMIGSAVSKGMDSLSLNFATTGQDSSVLENVTSVNQTGNYTQNQTDTTTGSSAADDISGMSQEELDLRLQFAMSVTFMVGVIQLIMGLFRLGFITVYLSDPLISGFTTGAACHVFTSQIKHVFGVKTARYSGVFKLVYTYRDFFTNIEMTNIVTLLLSVVCIAVLYCTSRFINQNPKLKPKMFMPVPIELIVVVLGTVISYALNLENTHNVIVVSDIPTGLPMPNTMCLTRISSVISDAIALAIVIFAISISMGKLLAKKHDYEVDANQELIAYGISTVVSSFFSSAAPSASLSRSLVQERVGGKTQVAGLISCCLLLVVLLAIGPYFRTLPNSVLASIIIVALRGMFLQVLDLKKLWRVSKIDFFVWIVSFVATVLLDVDLGLGAAVVFNLVTVVCRSQRPYACLLGQLPGTDIYRDMNVYQEAREVPGIKIFRFDHSLFFVNSEHFRTLLYKKTVNPRTLKIAQKKREAKLEKLKKKDLVIVGEEVPDVSVPIDTFNMEIDSSGQELKPSTHLKPMTSLDVDFHTLIFDCSPWSFVDSMGVKVLSSVIGEYKAVGVKVILANCKAGLREMFQKTKFYDTLDHSNIYVSLHDAVLQALHKDTPIPSIQADASDNGTSVADKDDSVTDYNLDYIDDDSIKGKLKPESKKNYSEA